MSSIDSSENKIEQFKKDITEEKKFEEMLNKKFNEQYDENLEDILLLEKDVFLKQIKEGVQLLLEEKYTDYYSTTDKFSKLLKK